jgi:hypothetical protein
VGYGRGTCLGPVIIRSHGDCGKGRRVLVPIGYCRWGVLRAVVPFSGVGQEGWTRFVDILVVSKSDVNWNQRFSTHRRSPNGHWITSLWSGMRRVGYVVEGCGM